MAICAAIKNNGDRCKASAIEGSDWCYNHDPAREEERKANARKGGRRGGRGRPVQELASLRAENADLRDKLLKGRIEPRIAAVCAQLINVEARIIDLGLKAKDQEELEERIASLEKAQPTKPRTVRRG